MAGGQDLASGDLEPQGHPDLLSHFSAPRGARGWRGRFSNSEGGVGSLGTPPQPEGQWGPPSLLHAHLAEAVLWPAPHTTPVPQETPQ